MEIINTKDLHNKRKDLKDSVMLNFGLQFGGYIDSDNYNYEDYSDVIDKKKELKSNVKLLAWFNEFFETNISTPKDFAYRINKFISWSKNEEIGICKINELEREFDWSDFQSGRILIDDEGLNETIEDIVSLTRDLDKFVNIDVVGLNNAIEQNYNCVDFLGKKYIYKKTN